MTTTLSPAEYRLILREDFMSFAYRSFLELHPDTPFQSNLYQQLLASRLDACRRGQVKRLIICLPPRSMKSLLASVVLPAWILGHNPSAQIICASYGQGLADKHALDCRRLMTSPFYRELFPNTVLAPDKQSINEFTTTLLGSWLSTSVDGVLTGRGADFIIIDDPLKPDEALSETRRKHVNDWFDGTLRSRLNNKVTGCIIIVMQRLHQDDLVGHVLEDEEWEVLRFPAIAEVDETYVVDSPLGYHTYRRQRGEALHPERESVKDLELSRRRMGSYVFESQYQQSPIPVGGSMIKTEWLRYYEPDAPLPKFYMILQSWDTANKTSELNDFSVCTTWGVYDGQYYLLDVFRRRLNYPDLKRAVIAQSEKFKPNKIVIEDKASGTQLIQELRHYGEHRVEPYKPSPSIDKLMRLYAQTAEFENGKVLLPRDTPWLSDYKRELTSFPGSKFDDQVDSTTQALEHLKTHRDLEIWAKLGEGYKGSPGWQRR